MIGPGRELFKRLMVIELLMKQFIARDFASSRDGRAELEHFKGEVIALLQPQDAHAPGSPGALAQELKTEAVPIVEGIFRSAEKMRALVELKRRI